MKLLQQLLIVAVAGLAFTSAQSHVDDDHVGLQRRDNPVNARPGKLATGKAGAVTKKPAQKADAISKKPAQKADAVTKKPAQKAGAIAAKLKRRSVDEQDEVMMDKRGPPKKALGGAGGMRGGIKANAMKGGAGAAKINPKRKAGGKPKLMARSLDDDAHEEQGTLNKRGRKFGRGGKGRRGRGRRF